MRNTMQIIGLLLFLAYPALVFAVCSWDGDVGTAASCAESEIDDCLNNIASGATAKNGVVVVKLPSCNAIWTTAVKVDMQAGFADVTDLLIMGHGKAPFVGSANETVLVNGGFNINTETNKKVRVSNITFSGFGVGGSNSHLFITGNTKPTLGGGFRIDHNTFTAVQHTQSGKDDRALEVYNGDAYGVVDHNNGGTYQQFSKIVWGTQHGDGRGGGNASWLIGAELGTSNAVYFEKNEFVQTDPNKLWMLCDGTNGARVVARYNKLTDYYISGHDASSVLRGILSYEAYNNQIYVTGTYKSPPISLRGGTGVVANNDITSETAYPFYFGTGINISNYRSCSVPDDNCPHGETPPWYPGDCGDGNKGCVKGEVFLPVICSTDADCEGVPGSCQELDGPGLNGYPCRDQIGRGKDNAADASQSESYPYLFWNNRLKKTDTGTWEQISVDVRYGTEHIRNGRDFCYGGTTMPTTCNGTAMTYSFYEYPHPLTRPMAPTNTRRE